MTPTLRQHLNGSFRPEIKHASSGSALDGGLCSRHIFGGVGGVRSFYRRCWWKWWKRCGWWTGRLPLGLGVNVPNGPMSSPVPLIHHFSTNRRLFSCQEHPQSVPTTPDPLTQSVKHTDANSKGNLAIVVLPGRDKKLQNVRRQIYGVLRTDEVNVRCWPIYPQRNQSMGFVVLPLETLAPSELAVYSGDGAKKQLVSTTAHKKMYTTLALLCSCVLQDDISVGGLFHDRPCKTSQPACKSSRFHSSSANEKTSLLSALFNAYYIPLLKMQELHSQRLSYI